MQASVQGAEEYSSCNTSAERTSMHICVTCEKDYKFISCPATVPVRTTGLLHVHLCYQRRHQALLCPPVSPVRTTFYMSQVRTTGMLHFRMCYPRKLQITCIAICVTGKDYRYIACITSEEWGTFQVQLYHQWGLHICCMSTCVTCE